MEIFIYNMLPKQLQNKEFGFTFLQGKIPYEKAWQNNPHTFLEAEQRLKEGKNYGVATGYGGLIVIDCDCAATVKLADEMPDTFTVKSRKGLHLYYLCPELKSKIVLKDIEELFIPEDRDSGGHAHSGEIMSYGVQVVGPGSIHPVSNLPYEIWSDLPIANISFSQIEKVFDIFLSKESPVEPKLFIPTDSNLYVTNISGFQESGLYEHPIHGATNGGNFSINKELNVWHCFRCDSGGGPLSLIGVMEGILDCSDCQKGSLRGSKFLEVKNIAEKKYNYQDNHIVSKEEKYIQPSIQEKTIDISLPQYLNDLSISKIDINWIWEGYIAKGKITLFSAIWKVGKSTLLYLLVKHISQTTPFMGKNTTKTNVLIITEEDEQDWVLRREMAGGMEGVWVHTYPFNGNKPSQKDWNTYFDRINEFCKTNSIGFVIVDTLANLGPLEDENSAVDVSSTMGVFKKLTKESIGVLVIHHTTKESKGIETSFRGSGAFGGFVDCLMTMNRVKNEDNQREVIAIGRREFNKDPITVELCDINSPREDYKLLGTSNEVIRKDIRELVFTAISMSEEKALTIETIYDMIKDDTDVSVHAIRKTINSLADKNELHITKTKEGRTYKNLYSISVESGLFNN